MYSFVAIWLFVLSVSATILQNGQVRPNNYASTAVNASTVLGSGWRKYPANASELSYKGRWDDQYISWWSAPGLKFGFVVDQVAISFGKHTSNGVLIATRLDGQDWVLTNITANSTQLLVTPQSIGYNLTSTSSVKTLELRVTNWAYGVQIASVHVEGAKAKLEKIPDYSRTIEWIGDSLSAGQYGTIEGLASNAWGLSYGIGETEFSLTAYPGICLHNSRCYDNMHGQTYQWLRTVDTGGRALELYGDNPPRWNFSAHPAADITIINLGTNDANSANNITAKQFVSSYIELIDEIQQKWPNTQIIVFSLWEGFAAQRATFVQQHAFLPQIQSVVKHFNNGTLNERGQCAECKVQYFNTTGILQHNDIGPLYHPTDVGHVKLASHLMQYIKLTIGWTLLSGGAEVQHDTLYWNDQTSY